MLEVRMNASVPTDTGNALKKQPRLIVPAQTNHKLIYVFLQLHPSRGGGCYQFLEAEVPGLIQYGSNAGPNSSTFVFLFIRKGSQDSEK
ncbi:hypothetical protein P7K49_027157 [Saguinus oedipus]|uniref:Uncharacterized protein n=1 Tax=Saguinus oedipus TaxID=9490 RepID=A0ABQ9UFB9_SAGOE|nr:hypothetical protein P7K49_027157 [Saguinus oedipus]